MFVVLSLVVAPILVDGETAPAVLDLSSGQTYAIALDDPDLDLAAFVVRSPQGEVILDEVVELAENQLGPTAIVKKHVANIKSATTKATSSLCTVVWGIQVCF